MITLEMPFDTPIFSFTLPNPKLSDSRQDTIGTKINFSMNGTLKSIIRRNQAIKLVWAFVLPKCATSIHKDNIDTMLQEYANDDIKITDWRGDIYRVKCITNPVEYTESKNFLDCTLEFAGTKQ